MDTSHDCRSNTKSIIIIIYIKKEIINIIIIMYIDHVLTNALSAYMIHINLNIGLHDSPTVRNSAFLIYSLLSSFHFIYIFNSVDGT